MRNTGIKKPKICGGGGGGGAWILLLYKTSQDGIQGGAMEAPHGFYYIAWEIQMVLLYLISRRL